MPEPLKLDILLNPIGLDDLKKKVEGIGKSKGSGTTGGKESGGLFGSLGTALATIGKIAAPIVAIVGILEGSKLLLKSIEALMKLVGLILRPIGDYFGTLIIGVFRMLMPLVKVLNLMWLPFQKKMMEAMKSGAGKGPAGMLAAAGDAMMIFQEFIVAMFASVIGEIGKMFTDAIFGATEALTVVIGGIGVLLLSALGLNEAAQALATGVRGAVGSLDLMRLTAKLVIDQGVSALTNALLGIPTAVGTAQTTGLDPLQAAISDLGTALGISGLDGVFTVVNKSVSDLKLTWADTTTDISTKMGLTKQILIDAFNQIGTASNAQSPVVGGLFTLRQELGYLANAATETATKIKTAVDKVEGIVAGVKTGIKTAIFGPKKSDFIMRPGQPAVSFDSGDTIVGTKGGTGGGGVVVNLSVSALGDRQTAEMVKKTVEDLFRKGYLSGYLVR